MNVIFLDDNEERQKYFKSQLPFAKQTWTAEDTIEMIEKQEDKIDFLFLDHDLGGEIYVDTDREDCGMEVVRWLMSNDKKIDHIIIHSFNSDAAKEMLKLRKNYKKTFYMPFKQNAFNDVVKSIQDYIKEQV